MTTERTTPPTGFDTLPRRAGWKRPACRRSTARPCSCRHRRRGRPQRRASRGDGALRKDIEISRWKIVAALFLVSSFVIAGVKFVLEWPIG